MTEPYRLTASEAGALMQRGELTVENYAKSLLSRFEERNPQVKAWAYLNPSFVLEQARILDRIPADERGPLHGIAIGVKDVLLTKDMPTRLYSKIYSATGPDTIDDLPVKVLRSSGALLFGKTTTTEFDAVTDRPSTTNPHDKNRTPGGSSSGSGAAVADFQVPIALASQIGGSTVRPGSFNGIFVLKPTWGSVERLGQDFVSRDTVGFYAREVRDLELLARVFRLNDDERRTEGGFEVGGKRIAFCQTHVWGQAGPGTRNAWKRAQKILSGRGAKVEDLPLPEEFKSISEWDDKGENTKLRLDWDKIASKYDAVLTPSVVDEAPLVTRSTGDASFCSMWTILQVPCLNIPGFQSENGMPIGLTLVGPRLTDGHVLWAGKAIGDAFREEGGWKSKLV